jgi:Ca-activated chloride channel family protein
MRKFVFLNIAVICLAAAAFAQSGRVTGYSESGPQKREVQNTDAQINTGLKTKDDDDVIRVETDLVTIPVRITERGGRPVPDVKQKEFKVFENGVEQQIAFFSNEDQPFTVALMLDMSYSSVFKLNDIQAAALAFVRQLRPQDKVMVVSFDEKARVLCEPTNDQKILRLAIEGAKIASGTSLYSALDLVVNGKFKNIPGRKAIVLLSDGVDTTSVLMSQKRISRSIAEVDALIYPLRYDTFDDVQKSRRKDAQILYDEDDRPYVADAPKVKGEREKDYQAANEFLRSIAEQTGGRVQRVSSNTNLNSAFARIADELRKTYSLGYYPSSERKPGSRYAVKVRVYRPNLIIRARDSFIGSEK